MTIQIQYNQFFDKVTELMGLGVNMKRDNLKEERIALGSSFLEFTKIFYYLRTGRTFDISHPTSRESHYISIARELTKVFTGEKKRLIINVPPRYGKAIDINTPILTRQGWTVAGEIEVGDEIVGTYGWVKVNGVYPQGLLPAKQVIFSDGQSVVCNAEHLWNVCDRYTPKWKTLNTDRIEQTLYEADGRKHWRIPLINGDYGDIEPFMDPYLFGCWLGDGHSHYAAITTMDREIEDAFRYSKTYQLKEHKYQNGGQSTTYGILGLSSVLRKQGLLKNKHIPEECYRWKREDRLALLQGLMDTDGTCGKNGQVSFTNTNKNIIKGCGYLVNSLGGIYRVYERKCGTQTLNIRLPDEFKPFRLRRKQKYVSYGIDCSPRRFISDIIDVEDVPMVCFTVDAEDKLFSVGEGLILTHNTELLIHFVAWTMAHFPDSNYIYVSYSHSLAKKQTQTIRDIISKPHYKALFNIELKGDTSAKDNFETLNGGSVYAVGSGGSITGRGAGIKSCNRFGGLIVIDDIHKPDEATSDTIREGINEWFYNTLQSRTNSPTTPIVYIGQRVHEDDLAANLIKTGEWDHLIIPAIDDAGNALHPQMHDLRTLKKMQEESPYTFAAQYQQDPQPAGGGIFKEDWFITHEYEPNIIDTFLTVDTAETTKDYNDATVFSFWGVYRIMQGYMETDIYALHWLDCVELRIEPKDLEANFYEFYRACMTHKIKPRLVAVEKKSTGVTLVSALKQVPGLLLQPIDRTKATGGKTQRFLEIQPFISSRRLTLPKYSKHTRMCIDHMKKITANNSHRFDDIADTAADAVKIALIDGTIGRRYFNQVNSGRKGAVISDKLRTLNNIRGNNNIRSPFLH